MQLPDRRRAVKTKLLRGKLSARGLKFAIIVSRFNELVTEKLYRAALECLGVHGGAERNVESYSCPGSFEIPQVAKALAESGKYDALICLGCVIRGETPHFEYVAGEAARGIGHVARATGVPIAFGVLTTDTPKQALDRAGGKKGNKGWDAALSAIEMASLMKDLRSRNKPVKRKR